MRLLPRDEKFFDLFSAVATLTVEAANLLQELLRADTQRRTAIVDQIKRLEHQADQVTHEVVTRLDRVFITPLDREDIHLLASRLDDVMDLIDGTARRLLMFHAGKRPGGRGAHRRRHRQGGGRSCQVAVAGAGEEQGRHGAGRLRPGEADGGGGRLALPRVARPASSTASRTRST